MSRAPYSDVPRVSRRHVGLLIVDDMVPSRFSPFRTLEYAYYLSCFDSAVLSLEGWHLWIENVPFDEQVSRFPVTPEQRHRLLRFSEDSDIGARLAYVTFLDNARRLMPFFRARTLPFILQLYPGGGLQIHQPETDDALRDVLLSELCRGVIVTQSITRTYIVNHIGCDPTKVTMIYGGVFDSHVSFDFAADKVRYPMHKDTLDLCFVAHKYGDDLTSKGYDEFVAIARRLAADIPHVRFHVIGNYGPADLPLEEVAARFTFYGRRESAFFASFYPRMDAIVSVNRPFVAAPGVFDGFPTGACIEAGFRGVLNCINDPLGLNDTFMDGKDLVLLDTDTERSAAVLRELMADPSRLYQIADANRRKFLEVFDVDSQLSARSRVIAHELSRTPALYCPLPVMPSELDAPPFVTAVPSAQPIAMPTTGPEQAWALTQVRRAAKVVWWTVTLQLPVRLREWRAARRLRASPAAATQNP